MFGEVPQPSAVPALLKVLRESSFHTVRIAVIDGASAVRRAARRGDGARSLRRGLEKRGRLRATAQTLLASRAAWALAFVQAIDAGKIPPGRAARPGAHAQALSDDRTVKLTTKHWGQVRAATPDEKRKAMAALVELVKPAKGDATAGKRVFTNTLREVPQTLRRRGGRRPDLTATSATTSATGSRTSSTPARRSAMST